MIRQQLELLEGALTMPDHPGIIRLACHSLARRLNEHVRREERSLAPYAHHFRRMDGHRMVHDHTEFLGLLRDIDTLFFSGVRRSAHVVVEPLSKFVKDLRRHIAVEERAVFPVIEHKKGERRWRVGLGHPSSLLE